jgi:ubiquinone/menaquinone biosynthesis C-methylase UbiE
MSLEAAAAPIIEHYGTEDLTARVAEALGRAGLDRQPLAWSELAPLDQFHVRGLAATAELAAGLELAPGATVLDVGCGLGGPARHLAAEFGAQVTGIDLSQPFVDVARMLAERCGLGDRVQYRQADALDLPFADASFDHAWTQHVAMNIADRAGFYRNIHRVLKPGGRLAIYDIVAGAVEPVIYPVPWARRPEISHLLTGEAMAAALRQAGFQELAWADRTDLGIAWYREQAARVPAQAPGLGLPVVMGPEFPGMFANLGRNLVEGRVRLVQTILRSV